MDTTNPDLVTHAFRTLFGMPPAKGIDNPACGATITDAYDFPRVERPPCPACAALIAAESKGA